MSYIVLNCNGAIARGFMRTAKTLIEQRKPTLMGLVETRCSGTQAYDICNILGFDYSVRVEALGYSGGIWILWKDTISIDIIKTHPQFIHAQVTQSGGEKRVLTIVYGSLDHSIRSKPSERPELQEPGS